MTHIPRSNKESGLYIFDPAYRRQLGQVSTGDCRQHRAVSWDHDPRHSALRKLVKSLQVAQLDQVVYWLGATSETSRPEKVFPVISRRRSATAATRQPGAAAAGPFAQRRIESARRPRRLARGHRMEGTSPSRTLTVGRLPTSIESVATNGDIVLFRGLDHRIRTANRIANSWVRVGIYGLFMSALLAATAIFLIKS
jgi:hypothetical protein